MNADLNHNAHLSPMKLNQCGALQVEATPLPQHNIKSTTIVAYTHSNNPQAELAKKNSSMMLAGVARKQYAVDDMQPLRKFEPQLEQAKALAQAGNEKELRKLCAEIFNEFEENYCLKTAKEEIPDIHYIRVGKYLQNLIKSLQAKPLQTAPDRTQHQRLREIFIKALTGMLSVKNVAKYLTIGVVGCTTIFCTSHETFRCMEGPDFLEYLHKNMYRVIKAGLYLGFFTHMGRHAGSFCADLLFEACHKSRSINNKSALKELMELEV